jgi:hypothetical protein
MDEKMNGYQILTNRKTLTQVFFKRKKIMNNSEQHLIERLKNASEPEQIHMSTFLLKAGRTNIILSAGGEELLKKVRAALNNFEYMVSHDSAIETIDSGRRISFK